MAHTRRRPITRDDLLNRLARCMGWTYAEAYDIGEAYPQMDALQELVEQAETGRAAPGERRSFARSMPTTTIQGQTRQGGYR